MEIEKVWVRHPRIDDGERRIEVPKEGLPHYSHAGWELTDAPPDPPPSDPKAPAETGASSSEPPGDPDSKQTEAPETPGLSHVPEKTPRDRRASTKESD